MFVFSSFDADDSTCIDRSNSLNFVFIVLMKAGFSKNVGGLQ